jgi:hypothetical protein
MLRNMECKKTGLVYKMDVGCTYFGLVSRFDCLTLDLGNLVSNPHHIKSLIAFVSNKLKDKCEYVFVLANGKLSK